MNPILVRLYEYSTDRPHHREIWINTAQIVSLEPIAGYTQITLTTAIPRTKSNQVNVRESPEEIQAAIKKSLTD